MNADHVFRVILLLGLTALLPVGVYHRLKSQTTGEKLDRRQEGLFLLVSIRVLGIAHMVGLLAFLISPSSMAWSAISMPVWLRWVGVSLGFLAGLLVTRTLRTLGPNLTDTVVTRKQHILVTNGPYRWVRHPFYIATALTVLANALATANVFLLVTGIVVVFLLVLRTRIEEAKLLERFGDDYRAYMRRTGKFFPRLS